VGPAVGGFPTDSPPPFDRIATRADCPLSQVILPVPVALSYRAEVQDLRRPRPFTDVSSIDELFGKYAATERDAAAAKAADAWVMTKDKVSLALADTGKGWELGLSFDEFVITKEK
jgi:hypothetical protein